MDQAKRLVDLFASRKARVGIIGMGYVGYPIALLAAEHGFDVIGIEIDKGRVDMINRGESHVLDVPSEAVEPLVKAGKISATTEYSAISDLDVVIITVPTPLNKTGDPDMQYIVSVLESMKPYLHSGMLIVLESTTYPGTTIELFPPAAKEIGLEIGKEIFIAFSPERVDPGNLTYNLKNTPKIVGGATPSGTNVACAFYAELVDEVVRVSNSTAAETVKLYENTFRAINIGLANELAIICNMLDLDVWEIIDAASTKPFGFMPFYPGPGLGGHCIPIDPSYLSWKMRNLKYKTRFIELANEINTQMPEYTVGRAMELLNRKQKAVNGSKVLLIGVAYKNDIDDLRESPAIDVYTLIARQGGIVQYHDPYCPKIKIESEWVHSLALTPEHLAEQDLVIITTGHRRNVDYEMIVEHAQLIFDTRNITRELVNNNREKIVYL